MSESKLFQKACLQAIADNFINGEVENMKSHLADYIHATVGMKELSKLMHKSERSLNAMLEPDSEPSLNLIIEIMLTLQKANHIRINMKINTSPVSKTKKAS